MKISIGSDNRGYQLKKSIIEKSSSSSSVLKTLNISYIDYGTDDEERCDYVDFAEKVAKSVASKETDFGILICNTGIGMSIAANKVNGIRAALCESTQLAEATRKHNDANIIAIGAAYNSYENVIAMLDVFLTTDFEGGRHQQRVNKITDLERN